ncbi:helicase-related protein [Haliangium ochraceum]|nr:helicase-related protein [Haliangium ochraceum]
MLDDLIPGTKVMARGLRWEVVHAEPAGVETRYRLRCLAEALRGFEIDLLSPFESIEPLASEMAPKRAANLVQWRLYHQAFLLEQALGPDALLAAKPGRLEIAPYQLVPLMRVLHLSRPRLLIADGVGLGKTVEAGFILAELIARRRAHRILLVTPPGPLLHKWQSEMRERFGLRFKILDREAVTEIRFQQELGANPFDHESLGLISIDFAKQERVLQDLERTHYDVVVIDEAHHCASLGSAGDREDSLRHRLAEALARRSDGLLLLTATPHDGHDAHFASLVELLDPSLVDGHGALRGEGYRRHVVRRLKRHIRNAETGEPVFREREVTPVAVEFDENSAPQFAAFQKALMSMVAPQLRRAARKRAYGEVLAFLALLKRSVSTASACRNTLQVVAERLGTLAREGAEAAEVRRQRIRTLRDYQKRLDRFGALGPEEEQDQADLEAEDMAAELSNSGAGDLAETLDALRHAARRERRHQRSREDLRSQLEALVDLAEEALAEDPKLAALRRELTAIRAAEPETNVLVYTEYADSQAAVLAELRQAMDTGALTGGLLAISGLDDESTRTLAVRRFQEEDNLILVSTDATAEGLDLHLRCHHLLHLELPYNPNRLEQRNGRIDRFGQRFAPQVRYLYLAGTFEERLLLRLVAKYERQRARLTFVPNTLGPVSSQQESIAVRLLEGLAADDGLTLFSSAGQRVNFDTASTDNPEDSAYQGLLDEVERAFHGFQRAAKTHGWLGDHGLSADQESVDEAARAHGAGDRVGVVDIVAFVLDAVRAESPRGAVSQQLDGTWLLKLAGPWRYGLDDIPGYEPDTGFLRLTTDMDQLHDDVGRPVGYLGRAHPIVRRALDRVRNAQYGGGSGSSDRGVLDRRVSAARGDDAEPALLLTFLGRVQSQAGRALERVLAVRIGRPRKGASAPPEVYLDHADWAHYTDPKRAVPTAGVWDAHFKAWAPACQATAAAAAAQAFAAMASEFLREHRTTLDLELRQLDEWLRQRSRDLSGAPDAGPVRDLFDASEPEAAPAWRTMDDGRERLSAFHGDRANPLPRRAEAESLLRLYEARRADLERRAALDKPAVSPLGMLLLVPARP